MYECRQALGPSNVEMARLRLTGWRSDQLVFAPEFNALQVMRLDVIDLLPRPGRGDSGTWLQRPAEALVAPSPLRARFGPHRHRDRCQRGLTVPRSVYPALTGRLRISVPVRPSPRAALFVTAREQSRFAREQSRFARE
jgi:hypothetical protein